MNQSLLIRTGQAWKVGVLQVGFVAATLIVLGVYWFRDSLPKSLYLAALLSAVLLGIGSFTFPVAFIRCPKCGTRWLWMAVSRKHDTSWLRWLVRLSACPTCSYTGLREQDL
jgi:hypothetical protein